MVLEASAGPGSGEKSPWKCWGGKARRNSQVARVCSGTFPEVLKTRRQDLGDS